MSLSPWVMDQREQEGLKTSRRLNCVGIRRLRLDFVMDLFLFLNFFLLYIDNM